MVVRDFEEHAEDEGIISGKHGDFTRYRICPFLSLGPERARGLVQVLSGCTVPTLEQTVVSGKREEGLLVFAPT